ncbi:hypothetical protein [Cellulomonas sp. RIT-PI-Y]|uniref:hypothetical protein n=1 Tax=Cellulomonas sp. RIT-PI-Y TaxID=3035297 RepID=UPI0021D99B69|nr:hypothetical protein [Cellulomonas sp. RIT-PI-Y]
MAADSTGGIGATDIRYGPVVAYSVGMPLHPIWQIRTSAPSRTTALLGSARTG